MILEVKNISFAYGGELSYSIQRHFFSVNQGQIISIIGPNGVGKTTLLNCMANLARAHRWEGISVEGERFEGA